MYTRGECECITGCKHTHTHAQISNIYQNLKVFIFQFYCIYIFKYEHRYYMQAAAATSLNECVCNKLIAHRVDSWDVFSFFLFSSLQLYMYMYVKVRMNSWRF